MPEWLVGVIAIAAIGLAVRWGIKQIRGGRTSQNPRGRGQGGTGRPGGGGGPGDLQ